MNPIKQKSFEDAIVLIKILDDGTLLVIDVNTTVRILDLDTLDVVNGFKGNITHERYRVDVVAFSSDGNYLASLSSDCKESKLYNVKTKKAIARVNRHHGEASCVGIDPQNRYMFSCGDDGKTFAVDMQSGKLAFTLPSHADTINNIAFSDNGQWIATASYDKKISLFNLAMMTPKEKMKFHASPVMKLQFLSNHRLFSIDKMNKGIISDIYTSKVIARLQGIHDDVLHVVKSSDDKFLFLGTALGYVLAYDLESYELISRNYIKLHTSITSLCFDEKTQQLIVGTKEGEILFYYLYEGEDYLKELLVNKHYDKMEEYIENNLILKYTDVYGIVDTIWNKTVEKAKHFLEKGDQKTAMKLFQNFVNIPVKNNIIKKIFVEYAQYDKFYALVKEGKFALAYGLANTHPTYKESNIYKLLEAKWQKAFVAAQKFALEEKGAEKAREVLSPYRGISEKTQHIQELFTQGIVYKRFKVALGNKAFVVAFDLIKQHPFLREFPEYNALMNYADSIYMKIQKYLQEDDTHSAIKLLKILKDFSDFSEEAAELIKHIECRQKFFNAIEDNDTVLAYNLLNKSYELQDSTDGKMLQKQWNDDLTKANVSAAQGDIKSLENILEKYMKISSKSIALATVFSFCYMAQLENGVKKKLDKLFIERGIKNYIFYFGLQEQILSFFDIFKKYYPDSKLNLELQTKGSMEMWRPSMIVDSILD
ncbi:hypothetical protein KKG72_03610 [bacterium]|nr:hypothetical protein [bacterium]MBU1993779.1 hypothetical protein [bacterium]